MEWYDDFSSSNVNRLGYEPKDEEMFVEFKKPDGTVTSTWGYRPLSADDVYAIRTATSVGKAVNQMKTSKMYSSRKVSG